MQQPTNAVTRPTKIKLEESEYASKSVKDSEKSNGAETMYVSNSGMLAPAK
ncbi:MAG: hypothetical protein ACI86X_000548 [Moritella sp.]|jgi:hypothetical protein